ncbi:hypothetical protein ACJJTC_011625 [Scirpophaga incertulas]
MDNLPSCEVVDDSFVSCSSDDYFSVDGGSSANSSSNLCDNILAVFSDFSSNFNVVHINAQSVPGHYNDLLESFNNDIVDAILISETFLKPSLPSTQFSIPGFKLIRNDRTEKGGGGVALYLRGDIPYNVVSLSPSVYSMSAEHIFVEVTLHHSKILVGVFYSPSLHIDYFNSLDSLFNDVCPTYDHFVLLDPTFLFTFLFHSRL